MDIAIIGIGCRFPGADGPASFWRLLLDRDGGGRTLEGIDEFDAGFFGMSPREAHSADPQLRLLLEVAWEAVEDSGLTPGRLAGSRTGVFVGQATSNYWEMLSRSVEPDIYGLVGSEFRASLPGRVSFHLDLRGPSVSVDTACSASLAAVHLACQSLRLEESALALAGGVNLTLLPTEGTAFADAGMLSPDGNCKFADAAADGFARSEGVGVVVLKPLAAAAADGDRVYAVIKGSAVNNDGRSNGQLMSPSVAGQEEMLRQAHAAAGIDAADVAYVEAHGTGTEVGDQVELTALANVLGGERRAGPCLVGSVKSNIGHTEAASGVAGLIKTALSLHHGLVPPTLHVRERTPAVPWAESDLDLPTEPRPLPAGAPGLAGVSSFGISGTNVHVVLAPGRVQQPPAPLPPTGHLFALSARTPEALRAAAGRAADLVTAAAPDLADLCYTAARRREHHEHRLVASAADHAGLAAALRSQALAEGEAARGTRVAFVFPGQGSQWTGMAQDLLATSEVFRETFTRCSKEIEREAGWSVLDRLTAGAPLSGEAEEVQPALWAVQVALAALWASLGVEPDLMIGHSMGEVAAACAAGVLGPPDGAAVICRRSSLARRISGRGAMVSVGLPERQARAALAGYEDRVAVAAVNGPESTVLSGESAALDRIGRDLTGRGVFFRPIRVTYASHSPQVDAITDGLRAVLAGVRPVAGAVPLWSTVLDEQVDGAAMDTEYWVRNLREPVRFADAVTHAAQAGPTVFLEISPHPILTGAVRDSLRHAAAAGSAEPSLYRDAPSWPALSASLAALHVAGAPVGWDRLYPHGRQVALPAYPWQRERYWFTENHPPGRVADPPAAPRPARARTPAETSAVPAGPDGVRERVLDRIADELGLPAARVPVGRPLAALGLDSLMAARLARLLREELGVEISARALLADGSLGELLENI